MGGRGGNTNSAGENERTNWLRLILPGRALNNINKEMLRDLRRQKKIFLFYLVENTSPQGDKGGEEGEKGIKFLII